MSLWWQQLLLVMLGGALGAAGRFWLGGAMLRQLGSGIPWGHYFYYLRNVKMERKKLFCNHS